MLTHGDALALLICFLASSGGATVWAAALLAEKRRRTPSDPLTRPALAHDLSPCPGLAPLSSRHGTAAPLPARPLPSVSHSVDQAVAAQ